MGWRDDFQRCKDADQRKIELEAQDADVIGKLLRQEREVVSLVTSIAQSRRHLASCEQEVDKLRAEHDQFSTQIAALESTIEDIMSAGKDKSPNKPTEATSAHEGPSLPAPRSVPLSRLFTPTPPPQALPLTKSPESDPSYHSPVAPVAQMLAPLPRLDGDDDHMPGFPTVVLIDGRWVEIVCAGCEGNVTRSANGGHPFYVGKKGIRGHFYKCSKADLGASPWKVWRVFDLDDVKRMELFREQPKEPIVKVEVARTHRPPTFGNGSGKRRS